MSKAPAILAVIALACAVPVALDARPPHQRSLKRHYGDFLASSLDACGTCHIQGPGAGRGLPGRMPPHNLFGARLRQIGGELKEAGKPHDLAARLEIAAGEDSDADGAPNEVEILAGRAPGDAADTPSPAEAAAAAARQADLRRFQETYAWHPFRPVARPPVPAAAVPREDSLRRSAPDPGARNPIDCFLGVEREKAGLEARPEAPRAVLLRRVYLDLVGLPPRPEELKAFLEDASPDAYEKVVERLLASPRHGERWARHWMDIWRYSDWAGWGKQVRDSQPHIWRWRDWIIESLNADKGYDRMLIEMLAGDEVAPLDRDLLRATGYLARSYKLLSREAWMRETVDHAAQAFLGITLGCARCHDHLYDPISQEEYYRFRAIFEPHSVRIDRLPGQPDTAKDGLARAFDEKLDASTFLYVRGDDRKPVKDRPLAPGVPSALGGESFRAGPVEVPFEARVPEKSEFIIRETLDAGEKAVLAARSAFEKAMIEVVRAEAAAAAADAGSRPAADEALRAARLQLELAEMAVPLEEARLAATRAVLAIEKLEDAGGREKDPEGWKEAARRTTAAQRWVALLDARRGRLAADREAARSKVGKDGGKDASAAAAKLAEAEKALAKAKAEALLPPSEEYARRPIKVHPAASTGRRLALARWLTGRENPLAARVAVNHMWLRHFGQALVPTVADFGQNGRPPSNPALLDWLAAELMEPAFSPPAPPEGAGAISDAPWSMKRIHRLIVTSSAYRMAATPDPASIAKDPDNRLLWRMPSRRLEAEVVRDAILHAAGTLDGTMGGPELDQKLALSTRRRSIYYRSAAEKQAEFLQLFDMAPVNECYERRTSIVPQQALALLGSELTRSESRGLAAALRERVGLEPAAFIAAAFESVLSRSPGPAEVEAGAKFLEGEEGDPLRARERLVHALLNLHEFVTVR